MKISLEWLNTLLEPGNPPLIAEEAERILTFAGFPIETIEKIESGPASGDTMLDVEVTSNRGDVLSHIGVAREVAAATGRRLKIPQGKHAGVTARSDGAGAGAAGGSVRKFAELVNQVAGGTGSGGTGLPTGPAGISVTPKAGQEAGPTNLIPDCPLFTIRIIRGVKVGPSPDWLVRRLEAIGQRSINNVVDVTNYVAAEFGQPTHVFDLNKFAKDEKGVVHCVIGVAGKGEELVTLDGKALKLAGDEIVVADGNLKKTGRETGPTQARPAPVSLAGVMGGESTKVDESTRDLLIEGATWSPSAVRRTARRFGLRTEASHRYERIVDPRTVDAATQRLCDLLLEVAGGTLESGVLRAGSPAKPLTKVTLRIERCAEVLGTPVDDGEVRRILESLGISVEPAPRGAGKPPAAPAADSNRAVFICNIPPHRPDLEREIDLIEEIARIRGLDKLPVHDRIGVEVRAPQMSERAVAELTRILTGLGFFEAVTFTFVPRASAKPFVPTGMRTTEVHDERRKADPVLRPSILPSLLACRRANQDSGGDQEVGAGGVRLFEIASVFGEMPAGAGVAGASAGAAKNARGQEVENVNIALIADASFPGGAKTLEQKQSAVRLMRGVIDNLVQGMAGGDGAPPAARVEFIDPPGGFPMEAYDPAARAGVVIKRGGGAGDPSASDASTTVLGLVGLLAQSAQSQHGLERPVVMAEISLTRLIEMFPPRALVTELASFPAIERDLSLIVAEDIAWSRIESLVHAANLERLEKLAFVGAYRGPQAGPGKKSVTLRMRFRDAGKTLKHEEVDAPVEKVMELAKRELGAEIRK